jgi:hypothetical protein
MDQRRVLILIAVVVFILATCALAVLVGVVAWPAVFGDQTTIVSKVDDPTWDVPRLPENPEEPPVDTPTEQRPIKPLVIEPEPPQPEPPQPEQPAATSTLSEIDLLPGVWQTVEGNARQPYGSAYQFFPPTTGTGGSLYLADDPSVAENWIEAEYELGAQGYLTISPVNYGMWAISSSYVIQFADVNTMYIWSADTGDETMPPAIMVRVQ